MLRFVVDEDMPRSTARMLRAQGYIAEDIRDHNLRSADDDTIFQFAQSYQAILVTGDKGFGNILRFPLGSHYGIFLTRFPNEMSTEHINQEIFSAIHELSELEFKGNLVVLEPGRMRIRRVEI
jgi:predicted nuclease of predicted toxin-antitoxin system